MLLTSAQLLCRPSCFSPLSGSLSLSLSLSLSVFSLSLSAAHRYARKAQAEHLLQRYAEAEASCRRGLEIDAGFAVLRAQLQMCRDAGHRTALSEDVLIANREAAEKEKSRGNSALSERKWDEVSGGETISNEHHGNTTENCC